jgi:hypothetical protein
MHPNQKPFDDADYAAKPLEGSLSPKGDIRSAKSTSPSKLSPQTSASNVLPTQSSDVVTQSSEVNSQN